MNSRVLAAAALVAGYLTAAPYAAHACDLCAIYSADQIQASSGGFSASMAEQVTTYHRLQNDGEKIANTGHQSMVSAITQLVGRYDFSPELGLQLNAPVISRSFRRPEGEEIVGGNESGLGDIALSLMVTPVRVHRPDFHFRWSVFGGIKMPTGDSIRLKEETEEGHDEGATVDVETTDEMAMSDAGASEADHSGHTHAEHLAAAPVLHAEHTAGDGAIESGVHGHDLALGSGAWDSLFGTSVSAGVGRLFGEAALQYAVRSEGDYDYRYQNDVLYGLSAGHYLILEDSHTLSALVNLTGEYKGMDVFAGNRASDTGVNSLWAGPEIRFTGGDSLMVQAGFDLPVFIDNTELQLVPDLRVHGAVTYRF